MHEWYKASFFTADLSVRKVEDTEFEPLGQLIRRIGNSREPFLVPQIGIPHGPPTTEVGTPFTPAAAGPGNSMAPVGAVQPPFAGAFPSFGTTLTAEQQNNLERRKQEEQFLMAQQREQLAQRQATMRQIQMNPASLNHHSSAHSLHSQPSFGSMTSPIGMPPQPPIPGASGFFDGPPRPAPIHAASGLPQDFFREDDLNRLSLQDRQQSFGPGVTGTQATHAQQINVGGQHSELQREAARMEQYRQNDAQGLARLREFEQLRAQHDLEESEHGMHSDPIGPPQRSHQQYQEPFDTQRDVKPEPEAPEAPSLTQQIQKAASAKQSPIPAPQPESPWAKVDSSMPMPFPPPAQSTTPLPAPTAQRGRSNLPDALNVDIRSRSETPEVAAVTPSVAPWAKESTEASRGPSLKQIQEAEAKKAAEAEKEAAALRRLALEQEMKLRSNQSIAPAAGLPTTSTWGSGASPSTPSNAPSPWATASALKSQAATAAASHKKTLADIQREEETRKQKAVAAAAAAQPTRGVSGGKLYADLASKASASGPALGGPWATVGAGGKVKPVGKIPTGPAASAPQTVRATSSASIPVTNARVSRPVTATRSLTTSGPSAIAAAKEEFNKWARGASKGLNSDVNGS
jgi:PERQ amino acid-rich with GYF domain-containing protein